MDLIVKRLELGKEKYGHGVRCDNDTMTWGTPKNSWMEMAKEEFLDGIIYLVADYIRTGRESGKVGPMISEDDNTFILFIIRNIEMMEDCIHKKHIQCLINMIDSC